MNREKLYELMTTILDRRHYQFDNEKCTITLDQPYTWDSIRDAKKSVLSIFGNPHIAQHKWEDDPIHAEYKFDSHFIEIDEETLQIDKHGRLFVSYEDIKHKLEKAVLSDEVFINKLARKAIRRALTIKRNENKRKRHH